MGSLATLLLAPRWMESWPDAEPLLCAEADAHWMAAPAVKQGQLAPQVRLLAVELLGRMAGSEAAPVRP